MSANLDHHFDQLYRIIDSQHGYFTANQAKGAGYSQQMQSYYAKSGLWIRRARGIFRYKHYPAARWQEQFYTTYLWTLNRDGKPEGVFSHGTALFLWELGTYIPPVLDLSVPKHFRRHSQPPARIELHKRTLESGDCDLIRALPVTKPLKTIIDLLETKAIDRDYILDALKTALEIKLLITHSQLLKYPLTASQKTELVKALQAINYQRTDEIR